MYFKNALFLVILVLTTTAQMQAPLSEPVPFIVTITNMAGSGLYRSSGVAQTPSGTQTRAMVQPGDGLAFTVQALPGHRLSFVTMLAQSNDLFFAPEVAGIALYDADGSPMSGDITDQIALWDAGTEINQPIGQGDQQAPRQPRPDSGEAENGVVQRVDGMSDYPTASDILRVGLSSDGEGTFTVQLDNVSDSHTIATAITAPLWVITPLVEATTVSNGTAIDGAFFTPGTPDRGQGLEALAEDGNPAPLATVLAGADMPVPLMPVVWAVHGKVQGSSGVFFSAGRPDRGDGLEALVEDGSISELATFLESSDYREWGVASVPDMEAGPGALIPGNFYTIMFAASPGESWSFVSQFVEANDVFLAPGPEGIPLFDTDGQPVGGEFTYSIGLWDAGTEVNEAPGVGANQMPRQAAPNIGADEMGMVGLVNDGFVYPLVPSMIRVTIYTPDALRQLFGTE